jgi:hypothetical protein
MSTVLLEALTPTTLAAVLRWVLSMVAGWLIAQGWLNSDQVGEVVAAGVTALVPILWSLIQKYRQAQLVKAALSLPAGATQEQAQLGAALARKFHA